MFCGEAKFSTWLYRLCLKTIFTIERKTNRIEYTNTANYEQQAIADPANNEKESLYKAIRNLPETERALVSLHKDGFKNQELSEMPGITANLAGVRQ